jgi:hypothetical protein
MWKILLILVFLDIASAQNSLTVTATRPTSATADLIVLSVDLITPTSLGRDDVFAAVQGSIVTPANFTGVRSIYSVGTGSLLVNTLDWSFGVTAPIGNFNTTITQLQALQQLVTQKKNGTRAGVGNVLAMSGATVTQPASGALFSSPVSVPSCTLTVKFALTGF